jgi:chorismate-pyruvate lyase
VFGTDMQGRQVLKRTVRTGWAEAPQPIAALLRLDAGERAWARELLIDGRIAELSVSYFPAAHAEGTGLTAQGDYHRPHGSLNGQTPYERLKQRTQARV